MTLAWKFVRLIAVACAVAAVAGLSLGLQFILEDDYAGGWIDHVAFLGFSVYGFVFAFPVAMVAGAVLAVPVPWLLSRLGLSGPFVYAVTGAVLGAMVAGLVWVALGMGPNAALISSAPGFAAGAAAGLLWWFGVLRHEGETLDG